MLYPHMIDISYHPINHPNTALALTRNTYFKMPRELMDSLLINHLIDIYCYTKAGT